MKLEKCSICEDKKILEDFEKFCVLDVFREPALYIILLFYANMLFVLGSLMFYKP